MEESVGVERNGEKEKVMAGGQTEEAIALKWKEKRVSPKTESSAIEEKGRGHRI